MKGLICIKLYFNQADDKLLLLFKKKTLRFTTLNYNFIIQLLYINYKIIN